MDRFRAWQGFDFVRHSSHDIAHVNADGGE
jgi:hypothetical protein